MIFNNFFALNPQQVIYRNTIQNGLNQIIQLNSFWNNFLLFINDNYIVLFFSMFLLFLSRILMQTQRYERIDKVILWLKEYKLIFSKKGLDIEGLRFYIDNLLIPWLAYSTDRFLLFIKFKKEPQFDSYYTIKKKVIIQNKTYQKMIFDGSIYLKTFPIKDICFILFISIIQVIIFLSALNFQSNFFFPNLIIKHNIICKICFYLNQLQNGKGLMIFVSFAIIETICLIFFLLNNTFVGVLKTKINYLLINKFNLNYNQNNFIKKYLLVFSDQHNLARFYRINQHDKKLLLCLFLLDLFSFSKLFSFMFGIFIQKQIIKNKFNHFYLLTVITTFILVIIKLIFIKSICLLQLKLLKLASQKHEYSPYFIKLNNFINYYLAFFIKYINLNFDLNKLN